MVETIKVDTTVDRIKSKSKEDRAFALKLDNHFCSMTKAVMIGCGFVGSASIGEEALKLKNRRLL